MRLALTLLSILLTETLAIHISTGNSRKNAERDVADGSHDAGYVPDSPPDVAYHPTPNQTHPAPAPAHSDTGISSGTPNNTLPDPCGPPNQDPGAAGSKSTCHQNVSVADVTAKEEYGVFCINDNTGEVLDQGTCSDAMYTICDQITGSFGSGTGYQATNKWIWSTQDGNCTFGYYLPEGGAPPPSSERCYNQIITPMNSACQGPKYNVGAVNLAALPGLDASGAQFTGTAVNAGYPSYIMVAQKSYCGVNSEDAC